MFDGTLTVASPAGGPPTVTMDPEVIAKLLTRGARGEQGEPVARLTPRERDELALVAESRSNAAITGATGRLGAGSVRTW
jgi:hypothetical protein